MAIQMNGKKEFMNYLRAITTKNSVWGEGVFIKRAMVNDDLLDSFIEWQAKYDPAIIWIHENFKGKNKYYINNLKSKYNHEWVFENKWKLVNSLMN